MPELKLLGLEQAALIASLTRHLNPEMAIEELTRLQQEMFNYAHYYCFGLYEGEQLLGISGGWLSLRPYSGKQLELDHVIIDPAIQSKGHGKLFLSLLEIWAKKEGCSTVELNTYVHNSRSHKFYFKEGYTILGFHFQKKL